MKAFIAATVTALASIVVAQDQIPVSSHPNTYIARANALLEQQPVIDTHNDWPFWP
jgi:hypothetical protein